MARSLKEGYKARQLQVLKERIVVVDKQLLEETKAANLLLEAMDEEDLKKVSGIIDKLRNIKRQELPALTKAIEQAEAELNKYTAGGPLVKAWTKLKGKVGIDNPIVKITTFASALEKGFSMIPDILKNNGVRLADLKGADLSKSLITLVGEKTSPGIVNPTGKKSDDELANTKFASNSGSSNESTEPVVEADAGEGAKKKLKSIADQLRKALSPGGIFGAFKKVPYIDSTTLTKELLGVPIKVFSDIAKTINSGAKAAEIAPELKDQIMDAGNAETKGTAPAQGSVGTSGSQPTSSSKDTVASTGTTPQGESPADPRGGGASSAPAASLDQASAFVDKIINALKKNPNRKQAIAKMLIDGGFDPNKIQSKKPKKASV